jgi:carbamoyl-phosphate synthase large subunit
MSTAVLLTGVGLDGGPDIIRALRADRDLAVRVIGIDADPHQPSRHLCDAFHQAPRREHPRYIEVVAETARSEGVDVVYPLPTFDQEVFASPDARERFERAGVAVVVSPPDAVRDCNDKWRMHERLRRAIPEAVSERRRVGTLPELEATARELGYPAERVCVRRRVSRGAIGFRVLDASGARATSLLTENPGSPGSLLVSLNELTSTLAQADPFPDDLLVEEYLPGPEWDVDVLCRDGEALVVAVRRNLAMTGGGAIHSVLERDLRVEALTRSIVAEVGLHGVANVAFRADDHGDPKLLEINPRIPSSILCALGGGVNLVALAVRQALGETIAPRDVDPGGEFLRYARSVIVDATGRAVLT